jgi:DNA end-binding protein Ku
MKAVWKGYLKCSLVTIPIKIYNAISSKPLRFHLLHRECGSPIKQEMVCPLHNRPLTNEEVVRGYRYGKDLHIVITDEDLQKAQKEATDTVEVLKFIDAAQIHPVYYADAHYLVPDGKAGVDAFALFYQAMLEVKKAALARVIWRNREHLLSIRPYNGAMMAFTLHFPEEIQGVQKIEEAAEIGKIKLDPESLALAKTIIQHLSGDFVPEEYRDEYSQTLLAIIKAKAEGEEFQVEPRVEREKVVSLMDALKKSVQATGKAPPLPKKAMARAGARARTAQKKRQRA